MPEQRILDFYVEQSVMTRPGPYGTLFDDLPADVAELVEIVQGLLVYEDVASGFYGFELPAERGLEKHLRTVEAMLERLLVLDDRPLAQPRPVERRLAGRCHHFMVLLLSMMRAKNIPSRARCGFGAYFDPGYYEDHWVVEYWNAHEQQWVLVDPQFDDVWRQRLQIQHNILDVPRDQFLVAADAWNLCVRDAADPARFGAVFADLYGLWYVAGNVVRDVAALNKVESLPWDVWGGQPQPNTELSDVQGEYFAELAALSQEPDDAFGELQKRYATDELIRVPETVFNAVLQRSERFVPAPTLR
jgi:Transglutaminase-like superfamily